MVLEGKSVLVTGGTGSLGKVLIRRILSGDLGTPGKVIVLSRDEAKQHDMRLAYLHKRVTTDEVIYRNFQQVLEFRIGDVRDYHDVCSAVKSADVVINAAALKQVPTSARLVHISTDCVFSGRKGMYTEDDAPDADDLYGRSKLLGEVGGPNCLTLRTSLVGRELGTTHRLVEWFLSNRGGCVRGYTGAIFSGFPTLILADIIADVIERHLDLSGIYHVSSEPISKYQLLCLLRDAYGVPIEIEPSPNVTVDRSLDSTRFRAATRYVPSSWVNMVQAMDSDPTPYEAWRQGHGS